MRRSLKLVALSRLFIKREKPSKDEQATAPDSRSQPVEAVCLPIREDHAHGFHGQKS